jgi:type VI secretion system protein ImpF
MSKPPRPQSGARSTLLLPVLLDRLTDLHPDNRNEAMQERTMTKASYRQSVLRDISWLLNTTNAESETDLTGADGVRTSVVNFGVLALSGRHLVDDDLDAVQAAIKRAIRTFEPRVLPDTLQVKILPAEDGYRTHNQLTMEIRGQLWSEPYPIDLLLRSRVDLESGQILLEDLLG